MGVAVAYNPCEWCPYKDSEERCGMCELTFIRKGWISVEERLPSEDERRDEYRELVPFLVCEKYTKYPYRAFYDGTIWGDGLMKIKGITHWMPLPEPPKMKGGAE